MQVNQPMAEGSRLFAVVQLMRGTAVAAYALVTRVERGADGLFDVAVVFARARLLPWQGEELQPYSKVSEQ